MPASTIAQSTASMAGRETRAAPCSAAVGSCEAACCYLGLLPSAGALEQEQEGALAGAAR